MKRTETFSMKPNIKHFHQLISLKANDQLYFIKIKDLQQVQTKMLNQKLSLCNYMNRKCLSIKGQTHSYGRKEEKNTRGNIYGRCDKMAKSINPKMGKQQSLLWKLTHKRNLRNIGFVLVCIMVWMLILYYLPFVYSILRPQIMDAHQSFTISVPT